jgi:hypothetical protein
MFPTSMLGAQWGGPVLVERVVGRDSLIIVTGAGIEEPDDL